MSSKKGGGSGEGIMVGSKLGSTWLGAEGRCPSSWFPHLVGCGLLL